MCINRGLENRLDELTRPVEEKTLSPSMHPQRLREYVLMLVVLPRTGSCSSFDLTLTWTTREGDGIRMEGRDSLGRWR